MCPQLARPSLHDVEHAAMSAWLTVEDLTRECGWSLRTARRRVHAWQERGWPRVKREATDSRKWRLLVERDSFDRYCAGEVDPPAIEDAAA